MLTENAKRIFAWINVCVIWGTTYLVIRIGVGHMPPMLFAGIRWVIAGAVFITILKWWGKSLPKVNEIVHLAVVGLALLGFANGMVVYAEQWTPSGLSVLLLTTINPVIALFLGWIILDEKLNFQITIAAAVIIAGVFIVKQGTAKLTTS